MTPGQLGETDESPYWHGPRAQAVRAQAELELLYPNFNERPSSQKAIWTLLQPSSVYGYQGKWEE